MSHQFIKRLLGLLRSAQRQRLARIAVGVDFAVGLDAEWRLLDVGRVLLSHEGASTPRFYQLDGISTMAYFLTMSCKSINSAT